MVLTAAFVFLCGVGARATAQTATFSYDDGNGVPNAGTYAPGSSFTFSITLNFAPGGNIANLEGLSYWFEQQNPNAPFYFAITTRNLSGSTFSFQNPPSITFPQNLTPQNSTDLGAVRQEPTGVGAGSYFVANLTISISPSALPGSYIIENTTTGGKTSVITDDLGHTFSIPQSTYTITIVPEPGSLALVSTGICVSASGLLLRRMRRGS